ncbi:MULTISPECIES: BMP family protein [Halanaerobium]|jgi:basic membrane protein A|uniref:Basic membrane protein A n=1 Tax=Halanaerobium kushneri TaxID=56779 RepID=A0A1N6Z4Y5_9FIRM|nr:MULTISPECIES: BMP family protein [Halanaerobium]RCW62329.1 basic membrane protein A [Halanaerobium sp. ST460_2HS_T2]SIR21884.1 basic membrane protein A [Halanaerobium kushneri]
MKFKSFVLAGILVLALLLAVSMPTFAQSAEDYKMVLLLPGSIDDQSWNATNYSGLVAANEELGTNIEYVENVQASDFESTMRNYAQRGYDLILAAGTQFDEAAQRISESYPETTFTVVNGVIAQEPNLKPVMPKEYEASFLAGIIAGHVTETNKLGLVGGFPNRQMIKLLNTYVWGARTVNEDVESIRSYANSWSDVSLGNQMANSMIDDQADVLFFYANEVGLGAIQAADERGAKFIGFASNQNDVAPGTVQASVYLNFEGLYVWIVENFMSGELEPIVNEVGVNQGIVEVVYSDQIGEEVKADVEKATEAIRNGDVLDYFSLSPEALDK